MRGEFQGNHIFGSVNSAPVLMIHRRCTAPEVAPSTDSCFEPLFQGDGADQARFPWFQPDLLGQLTQGGRWTTSVTSTCLQNLVDHGRDEGNHDHLVHYRFGSLEVHLKVTTVWGSDELLRRIGIMDVHRSQLVPMASLSQGTGPHP